MGNSETYDWRLYSSYVWNISRSMRLNPPTASEMTAVETFLKTMYDPAAGTGTRTWLESKFNNNGEAVDCNYDGDPDEESNYVNIKNLGVVGRDMMKNPIQTTEETNVDTLITATGDRYLRAE